MSKQEEIDRLLNLWADDYCLFVEKTCEHRGMYCYCCSEGEALKCLKERLGEQGVVILAPDVPINRCSFVEPLIKE